MTRFSYRAYGKDGTETKGVIDAGNRLEAARLLSKSGRKLVDLREETASFGTLSGIWTQIAPRHSMNYHRLFSELAILLQAGFPIDAALKAIAASQKGKSGLAEIVEAIGSGSSFSEAVAKRSDADPAVTALVVSGEHSGRLDEVVLVLAAMFEEEKKRKADVLEALLYPAFLVLMMLFAVGIIMFALVPAIDPVFEGLADKRPVLISVLAAGRLFLLSYGWLIPIGALLAAAAIVYARRTAEGRDTLSLLWLKIPFLGRISGARGCARYLQVLGMLLANGVPMKKALELSARSCPVTAYQPGMTAIRSAVTAGMPFRQAARESNLFDSTSMSLIEIGDEANRLADALKRAAFLLETEASRDIRRVLTLLTPVITIVMGGAIGGIVVSVMDALLSINNLAVQ
ncbi:type II secretion system F family protein [Pararhizobium sp.]|uniref:type II secretion system F family protein n=2 Tax=Pararhizobium sp. TaxID=1977563 RepID=UPI003BAD71D0